MSAHRATRHWEGRAGSTGVGDAAGPTGAGDSAGPTGAGDTAGPTGAGVTSLGAVRIGFCSGMDWSGVADGTGAGVGVGGGGPTKSGRPAVSACAWSFRLSPPA